MLSAMHPTTKWSDQAPGENGMVLTDSTQPRQSHQALGLAARRGQADSQGERDFKQKTIKVNSEEIQRKEKECQHPPSLKEEFPQAIQHASLRDQASVASRWLRGAGQELEMYLRKSKAGKANTSSSLLS